jgi:hypothetical protein
MQARRVKKRQAAQVEHEPPEPGRVQLPQLLVDLADGRKVKLADRYQASHRVIEMHLYAERHRDSRQRD